MSPNDPIQPPVVPPQPTTTPPPPPPAPMPQSAPVAPPPVVSHTGASPKTKLMIVFAGIVVVLLALLGVFFYLMMQKGSPSTTTVTGAKTEATANGFSAKVGQTKTDIDAAAAKVNALPLCTTAGTGTTATEDCKYVTNGGASVDVTYNASGMAAAVK